MVEDTKLGTVRAYPDPAAEHVDLKSIPVDEMVGRIRKLVAELRGEGGIESVGAGFPGIVCDGVIEDSPNLGQLKGLRMGDRIHAALLQDGLDVPVRIMNDADALAAGIAATHGGRDKLIRVWYLGDGVGFGRCPHSGGIWEAGHTVVSLDPKERFCGCGGHGHLEGILGMRAMRQRFLDMEPEEIFAAARHGDTRAKDFVNLWHRALAAATATNVHLDGPGRIYIAGPNSDFVDLALLNLNLQEMVRMSPLQGTYFEIVPTSHDLAIIGAAVSSARS
jgi:predicted NBD/HSP70 family sugar kinase